MSNLVDHARRELELIGEEGWITDNIVSMVEIFASAGHSGSSAEVTREILCQLLAYEPLSPLTDDPDEWERQPPERWPVEGESVWQNRRDSRAFSHDGGKTYWLVHEREYGGSLETTPLHRSKSRSTSQSEAS